MLILNPSDWFLTATDPFVITNPSVILSGFVQTKLVVDLRKFMQRDFHRGG
jgi:hypothetical protein